MMIQIDTDAASAPSNENMQAAIKYLVETHREAVRSAIEAADQRDCMTEVLALRLDVDLES